MITWALRLTRTRADVDAARGEHVELVDQRHRVDDDAVADDRRDVRVEHARRRQVELEDLVAADDRVAGVVAALVADDHRDLLGQEVGRLALALVAPLEPDDHGGGHQDALPIAAGRRPRRSAGRARRPTKKAPDLEAWDLDRRLPRRSADRSADRRRLVARTASRDGRCALEARSLTS